jgi:hypothetical protein
LVQHHFSHQATREGNTMTTSITQPPTRRRTRWLAACAITAGLGAGIVTAAGVASADEGTAPNNSVTQESINPTVGVAPRLRATQSANNGSMQILTTVVKEMQSERQIGSKNMGS